MARRSRPESVDPTAGGAEVASAIAAGETGSSTPAGVIRIVVLTPGEGSFGGPSPMSVETTAALGRLGDPVELLRALDADELGSMVGDPFIDGVLFDRLPLGKVAEGLARIPFEGPPAIVVIDGDGEADALEAFRAGAADCVHFGPDYENVLPVVLLEQVQRWRGERRRRLSEQRIHFLEELNTGIVSAMPAGLVVVDAGGLIVSENPEFARCFPSRSEAGAAEFLAARLPSELVEAVRALEGGSEGDEPPLRLVRVADDEGTARAYEVRHRILDGAEHALLVLSDVTESEWLSDRLEALRRDTRDIIENINSALVVVDLAGRITFANPAAERILGGRDGDLGGRQIEDWFGPPGNGSHPIEACLVDGTRSRGAETLLRRADGSWIPVGISCSPRLDGAGRARGVVAVFQDLSEIKELELQVRQTEKMASIGQLAAGVAHEVNNPMGFIHANLHQMSEYLTDLEKYFEATDRLQRAAVEGDLELVRAAAADVQTVAREIDLEFVRSDFEKALMESGEGADRIRHIVKDLRDFSRPDLPARSAADVNQAVDSTANIVYTMMKHDVLLEKEYAELPKIEAYPMQLKQVFMNLLVNAHQAIEARAEATGAGEKGIIRIETEEVGSEVCVRIADTGIGIPEDARARIFEPFFTTKPVGTGTGLGLSTSFNIVERHGGRIAVESEEGEGTVFEVWLPVYAPKTEDLVETDEA